MRAILINILVILAVAAIGGVVAYLVYNNYNFYSTDDAQVTSNIVNITTTTPGTLNSLSVPAVVGQVVTPGVPLAQETDLSSVTITAYVDEGVLNNISTGQSVDIKVDAYSDTSFTGHVSQIINATASEFSLLPTQDNASGNFTKVGQRIPVIITLDGSAGKTLMPGMSATVTIHLH